MFLILTVKSIKEHYMPLLYIFDSTNTNDCHDAKKEFKLKIINCSEIS